MFTFIHAADVHLDSPLHGLGRYEGAPVDEIREAGRRALAGLIDYILENNIPLLLIAGDLYDADCPDFQTLLHFSLQMDRLRQSGTRVALIRGNHDAGNTMTRSLRLPDNVRTFASANAHSWRIEDIGAAVHGQSFGSPEVLENLVPAYPDPVPGLFNIGLLHTSISGRPGHKGYAPCELNHLLAKGYDYWALGHVHRYEVVHENPYVVFSGCIQGRHIKEPGPRGCIRVDVDNSGAVSVQRIILDVFRWQTLEIDITGLDTFSRVMDQARVDLEEMFARESEGRYMGVRLILTGVGPAHDELVKDQEFLRASIHRAAADVSGHKIWLEKIILDTLPAIDFEKLKQSRTPQGDLARFIDELENDPQCFEKLGFTVDDLSAKLTGTGVNLPDLNNPEIRRAVLADARRIIIPILSKTVDSG